MMKILGSLVVFSLFLPVSGLCAEKAPTSESPLSVLVLENGLVRVFDQMNSVAIIVPQIFSKGWGYGYQGFGDYRKPGNSTGSFILRDGTVVDFQSRVERLPRGLHIHYSMTAPKDLEMSCVRATVAFPYVDWQGASYRFNEKTGEIPLLAQDNPVIAQDHSDPLTLGPSPVHGLTLGLDNGGYLLTLQDNRKWSPDLLAFYTHGESGEKTWTWKKGEEKTFDFTVNLNRAVEPFPQVGNAREKGLEGHWYGIASYEGQETVRISAYFQKGPKGEWVRHFYFDSAGFIGHSAQTPKFSVEGKNLKAQYADGALIDLALNPAGDRLAGTGQYLGKTYEVKLSRGQDFRFPQMDPQGLPLRDYTYRVPVKRDDGWEVGDLTQAGFDAQKVSQGVDRILDGTFPRMHSLVVLRHGKILLDEYFYGYGPGDAHPLFSTTKSFFSTLFGIAQDQGLWNVSQKLYDLYPEYREKSDWDPKKDAITLGNLLAMDSGFDEDDMGGSGNQHPLPPEGDWVDHCLSMKLNPAYRGQWVYDGSVLQPLPAYLVKKTGKSLQDFADQNLFGPLGISTPRWTPGPQGIPRVDTDLWLTPRDMAKLGQLYLDKGLWKGKRILSAAWVEAATTPKGQVIPPVWWHQYGYLWWLREMDVNGRKVKLAEANGYGGQVIWVVPAYDMVCVMTSGNYDSPLMVSLPDAFLKEYVLSAVEP
jgi:CubicO group peptidase (beta-lactamase class C family)